MSKAYFKVTEFIQKEGFHGSISIHFDWKLTNVTRKCVEKCLGAKPPLSQLI